MPNFPSIALSRDNVAVRFLEPTASKAINRRFMGLPRGVYIGFTPSALGNILTLAPDATLGFSTLKVGASSTKVQLDIFTTQPVTLDFTGHTQFPVYVVARGDYATGTPTQARILTRTTGPAGPQEVGVCFVDKVGGVLTIGTALPDQRQTPVAFEGQQFGYMYGGATNDILTAQGATDEVVHSRTSLTGPTEASLSDRLAIDLASDFLASQLGFRTVVVVGNSQIIQAVSSANVSTSFSEITRQLQPFTTLAAGGNETTEGVIAGPADAVRNICFVIDDVSGARVVDVNNNPIHGRLTYATSALPGNLTFLTSHTTVAGSAPFTAGLQVGDLIQGLDGLLYPVASITDATHLELPVSTPYRGANATGVSAYRRFTLTFYSRASGAQVETALTQPTTVRFFFPAWFRSDKSIFDASAYMKRDGERLVEPVATPTLKGLTLLATSGALPGTISQVSSNHSAIGSNFHTLNFTATNASVMDAGGGVANITVPGDQGPPGSGVTPGGDGPQGDPGAGAKKCVPWVASTLQGPAPYPTQITGTYTVDFSNNSLLPGNVVHAVGGFNSFTTGGAYGFGTQWTITGMSVSGTFVNLYWMLGNEGMGTFFIGASY